jgi:hypothetical protein
MEMSIVDAGGPVYIMWGQTVMAICDTYAQAFERVYGMPYLYF